MRAERDLYCHPWGIQNLTAVFDSEGVQAAGDAHNPLLQVRLQIAKRTENGPKEVRAEQLMCWAVTLYPEGDNFPLSQTGLQAINVEGLFLSLNHQQIEALTKKAESHQERAIHLAFGAAVVAPSDLTSDRSPQHLPPWLTHTIPAYSKVVVVVPSPRWYTFLKTWGYPETRLVPISMELPVELATQNPVADAAWRVATIALTEAVSSCRDGRWGEAGLELRRATEQALYTWCSIWGNDDPADNNDASAVVKFFDQALPSWDPARGEWPKKTTKENSDVQRVCTRYHTLRQLYRFSHAVLHTGERPLYTAEDIDYLLTSTVALFRTLPTFWVEYPAPDLGWANIKGRGTADQKG